MHHQRSQCESDDEVDNVAAIPHVAIMESETLGVFDNSIDDIDLPIKQTIMYISQTCQFKVTTKLKWF